MDQQQQPSIGRIVRYVLNEADADVINARPMGAFSGHNPAAAGMEFPALIVRVWGGDLVNLQVFYDGDGSIWATSRGKGTGQGMWNWPAR